MQRLLPEACAGLVKIAMAPGSTRYNIDTFADDTFLPSEVVVAMSVSEVIIGSITNHCIHISIHMMYCVCAFKYYA